MIFEGFPYGTTWFVSVGAVGETAVLREMENLLEIACELFWFHVERAEALDAWGVDNIRVERGEWYHLAECRGVHTCLMGIADVGSTQVSAWHKTVDERRFAYTAVAAQHGNLTLKQGAQLFHSCTCLGRDGPTLVANGLIELYHHLLIAQLVSIEQVGLVENQDDRHAISLSRSEKTINERGAGLWLHDGDHQECLIHVCCDDMALLGEVDAFSDDVIPAVFNLHNKTIADLNVVAYGYGVRTPYATQAEVAFYLTINKLAIVRTDGVPASCILDDESLHGLHSHDFLVLGLNELVELFDVLVV